MRQTNKIIIHCSDSDRTEDDDITIIDGWHKKRGMVMVGYHFYIRKDGKIQAGRNLLMPGAHTLNYNHDSIGICLAGSKRFTDAQFKSLKGLIDSILSDLKANGNKGTPTIHGHCEFNRGKTCPNFDYKKFIRDNNYA